MTSKFTCKVQLAKHDMDEVIDIGEVDFSQFLREINGVDWEFESDRLQFLNKTSPAIGVTNCENGAVLWTSPYRPLPPAFLDKDEFRRNMGIWFVIKLDSPPSPPEIINLESRRSLSECYFETYDQGEVESLFELFFEDHYESLYESLYSLRVCSVDDS